MRDGRHGTSCWFGVLTVFVGCAIGVGCASGADGLGDGDAGPNDGGSRPFDGSVDLARDSAVLGDGANGAGDASNDGGSPDAEQCSFASRGHPGAVPVVTRSLGRFDRFGGEGCSSPTRLIQSAAEFASYSQDAGPGLSGGAAIDWSQESVAVIASSSAVSMGQFGRKEQTIVALGQTFCQGIAPHCVELVLVVPKALFIDVQVCPLTEPCLAP